MITEPALQMYTIRKFLKNKSGRNTAFRQMTKAGIRSIEPALTKFTLPCNKPCQKTETKRERTARPSYWKSLSVSPARLDSIISDSRRK